MNLDDLLPHRPPFRFVDEVISAQADEGHFALELTTDDPRLSGSDTLMPVLLVEAMAQAAAAYHGYHMRCAGSSEKEAGVLSQIDSARFYGAAHQGERVEIHVTRTHQFGPLVRFSGVASRDGETLAEAQLTVARTPAGATPSEGSAP